MTQPKPRRSSYNFWRTILNNRTPDNTPKPSTKLTTRTTTTLIGPVLATLLAATGCATEDPETTLSPTTPNTNHTLPALTWPPAKTNAPNLDNTNLDNTQTPTTNQPTTTPQPKTPTNTDNPNIGTPITPTTKPTNTTPTQQPSYYLALGDSLPAGFDPVTRKAKTTKGYPAFVAQNVGKRWGSAEVKLINHSCSGESSQSFRTGSGSSCFTTGSQLSAALQTLKEHGANTRLITVHLGANNILPCMQGLAVDRACADRGIAQTKTDLAAVLPKLRKAAPNAQVVVVNYYNPMLTLHSVPAVGPSLAKESQAVVLSLNSSLGSVARQHGAQIANVAPGFQLTDWTPTGPRQEPQNLVRACELTGMCDHLDIHPKPAGHTVIARAITATVR